MPDDTGPAYLNETLNDRWIVEEIFPGRTGGYFVEIGAANGIAGSSCYILEHKLGWHGICVEPNSMFFSLLRANRPVSHCEDSCISDVSGDVQFVEAEDPYLSGIKANLLSFKYRGSEVVCSGKTCERKSMTLAQLLEKYRAPRLIDYFAMDAEGSELRILEDFPFDRFTFKAISLECDGTIWDGISGVLQSNGYQEVRNPFNEDKPWERYWLHDSLHESHVNNAREP